MDVRITIDSTRHSDGESESMQLVTDGTLEFKNQAVRLTYKEDESMGAPDITTVINVEPDCITMQRHGEINTLMVMQKGKRTHCDYDTGFGSLLMGVYTRKISSEINNSGGALSFAYTLDINAGMLSEHEIDIKIENLLDGEM